jgi:hypothetical protein
MPAKKSMTAKEYDESQSTAKAVDYIDRKVIPKIPQNVRPFFRLKYCSGTKLGQKALDALIKAILIFSGHVNVSKKCTIFIGNSPFHFDIRSCGSFSYEQNPEVMATTILEHNIVFLDFQILSRVSPEVCVASILEEFVHAFLDVPGHPLANHIVCLLYPEVTIDDRNEYQVCAPLNRLL